MALEGPVNGANLDNGPVEVRPDDHGYEPVVPEARPEDIRIPESIEDAKNLNELFQFINTKKDTELSNKCFNDIVQIPREDVYDDESLKEDLSPDLDFQCFATKILARVIAISEETQQVRDFDVPDFVHLDALLKVKQQLIDSSVYICVLGRYNVGKTTLINALIGEDVLPVSISPETAVTLYIQHDDKVEQSYGTPLPRLINWSDSLQVTAGIQNIRKHLKSLHERIRCGTMCNKKEDYLLKINLPLLHTQGDPKPYLVDTPGSNEVGKDNLQKISELNLKSAAAYIFVMKYDDIKNKEDYEAFKIIHERDPQIFQSERLTIVVTHYDTYFQNQQAQVSVADVKRTIAKTLTQTLKLEVSENIIFPVCGKWASDARQCKYRSSGGHFNDLQIGLVNVEKTLNDIDVSESFQKVLSMSHEEVLEKIERISLITELEERISMVTTRLSVIWKQNIITSCKGFLKAAQRLSEYVETKYAKEIKETEYQIECAQKVVDHHKAMLDSISERSSFLAELEARYTNDTEYEGKFRRKVDDLLNQLRTLLLDKKEKRKYSIQQLNEDINEKFYSDAETRTKGLFLQTKFTSCQKLLHRYTQRVSEKFGRLRSAAALVVEQKGFAPTLAGHLNPFGDNDFGDIDEKMEDTLTDLRSCRLNEIITETYWIRMWFPLMRANVIKDDNLERLVEDRREAIKTQHHIFFEGVKEEVILYFFKAYCNVVMEELKLFITLIEQQGQTIQLQHLKERKEELTEKKRRKKRYSSLKEHFAKLSARLSSVELHD